MANKNRQQDGKSRKKKGIDLQIAQRNYQDWKLKNYKQIVTGEVPKKVLDFGDKDHRGCCGVVLN